MNRGRVALVPFLILVGGAHGCLVGCAAAPKIPVSETSQPKSCSDCPDEGKFSITIENASPQLFVRGVVDGQPKRFMVDTGAYRSNLAVDEQTRSILAVGKTQFASFSWKPKSCDWIRIQSFQAAGTLHSRVGGKGGPILRCDSDPPMTNILGMDYLDYQILSLKVDDTTLTSVASFPEGVQTTEMRRNADRHIIIPIRLAGERVWAVFDTGSGFSVVDQEIVSKNPGAFHQLQGEHEGKPVTLDFPVSFSDGTGKQFQGRLFTTDQIQVGDQKLAEQVVMVIPLPKPFKKQLSASVILGATSILATNWLLDLRKNVWASTPSGPSPNHETRFSVNAGSVSTEGKTVILSGNAKFFEKGHELTGDRIVFDTAALTVDCSGGCSYKADTTITADSMSFSISDKDWKPKK